MKGERDKSSNAESYVRYLASRLKTTKNERGSEHENSWTLKCTRRFRYGAQSRALFIANLYARARRAALGEKTGRWPLTNPREKKTI